MADRFVSRAGEKLEHALTAFGVSPAGKVCADLGSSKGGFVDCLLARGAKKVYAVDTAYGELDWKLRQDPRVVVLERTNALHVELPEKVELVTIDTGWTQQRLIVPKAIAFLKPGGEIISLLKPHYESTPAERERGKVKPEFLPQILERVKSELKAIGVEVLKTETSPLLGEKGKNVEYLLYIKPSTNNE